MRTLVFSPIGAKNHIFFLHQTHGCPTSLQHRPRLPSSFAFIRSRTQRSSAQSFVRRRSICSHFMIERGSMISLILELVFQRRSKISFYWG